MVTLSAIIKLICDKPVVSSQGCLCQAKTTDYGVLLTHGKLPSCGDVQVVVNFILLSSNGITDLK